MSELKVYKKSTQQDNQGLRQKQQEVFALKRGSHYWSKVEKAAKSKADGKQDSTPPIPFEVRWHSHQVEEEPARIDLSRVVKDALEDPTKVIALGGGDPGIRVQLEVQKQTMSDVYGHLQRYKDLFGNMFDVLSGKHWTTTINHCSAAR